MNNFSITLSLALSLTAATGHLAQADQVINDDLVVTGDACIGANCVDGFDYGNTSLVLDSADASIRFNDTSNSSSFPTVDWRVGVDSASNTFSIGNFNSAQTVFAVNAAGDGIAIGSGATLTAGAVSVGGMRIANVADGLLATDAATLGQLNAAVSALPTDYTALQSVNGANAARLDALSDEIDAVGAIGSAMSALQLNPRGTGDHFLSIGLGTYEGSSALAVGSFHFLAENRIFVNTGISAATDGTGGTAARLGVTFGR